ncbi:tripartite tricarboxylate transporter substrate binding protein [Bordetella sp. BOR01]|uniref:Bug family tripartite tricarboxylate transporter substrate binding protein n=1 Tax=Bordetella sp. BOR01 TaxID=2854779 RepID=UPI001C4603FF|nr:tripartite tricarboxylate transporter substrate binding protein [Bordetella sp. BOR01]MBV7486383.1 tripartite tricarboxylate transporter substrate binding protein [Bordetella sp. BOR01]
MKLTSKLIGLAAAVALGLAGAAQASGPLTMIVPFSAGGSTDILARVLAKDIGQELNVPVVVENKPGAEGFIAARQLRTAKPDGNTLMLVTTSVYAINPAIFTEIPYDSAKDFTTVSVVASSPNVILAASNAKYASLKDVLAAGSKDDVYYATGATMHLLNAKWLEALSGARMTSVPYKGSAAAYPDLIAGRVDFMVDQPLSSLPFIQQGQLKALAVTSEKRWPRMPDVPTVAEQGFPDFSTTSWWAVLAPAGTPAEVVQKLHDTIAKGLARADTQEKIHQIGADIESMSLPQAQAYTAAELEKWQAIAKTANVKMN